MTHARRTDGPCTGPSAGLCDERSDGSADPTRRARGRRTRHSGKRLLTLTLGGLALAATAPQLGAQASDGEARTPFRPLEPTPAFEQALAAGTRAPDGRPGPEYWQQEAHYRIRAELNPGTGRVSAREVITYRNRSPDTLGLVVLRLEQNVFAEGARRNRRAPITGGMSLEGLEVDGQSATSRHVGGSYYESLTLLQVELPSPLPPGDDIDIQVRWSFTVPPASAFRTGNMDGEVFAVAQWYPRMAVYDDVYGWDVTPYLGDGEFYLEYGDFDVEITVPGGWLVGATGTLQNPEAVLPEGAVRRLREAVESDEPVRVVTEAEVRRGEATRTDEERLTWRFTASDVRDFAFATSPEYVWDAAGVDIPGRDERVLAHAFYRPRLTAWTEGTAYVAHALRTLSEWIGPYPYPQASIAETSVGGMEYPMFIFNPSTNSDRGLAGVTVHEVAHQWFPMAVGTMEAKHAWMDEGIGSYWEELSLAELYGSGPPRWGTVGSYLRVAGREVEVPLMQHTDLVSPYGARTVAAYTKPAVVLGALRSIIGDETFVDAFREFYTSWRSKHPQPWDFFNTMERHHGQNLDWFWRPFFFETDVLDHAVVSVETENGASTVRVEDLGQAVLPTPVLLVLEDGTRREERISHREWLEGGRIRELSVEGRVVEVVLDPDALFPDVDRSNNGWRAP